MARFEHVDGLRGVAAFTVMIVHYMCAFFPFIVFGEADHYLQHYSWEAWFFIPPFGLFAAAHLAVCVFFIISGYVLTYKYLGRRLHLLETLVLFIKRPVRLGGLVWVSLMMAALFWTLGWFQNNELAVLTSSDPWSRGFWAGAIDLKLFVEDLIVAPFSRGDRYNAVLWTIKYELYGSFQLFCFLMMFSNWRYRLLPALVMLLLSAQSLYVGFWIGMVFADLSKSGYLERACSGRYRPLMLSIVGLVFMYLGSYPNYVAPAFLESTVFHCLPSDSGFLGGYPMIAGGLLFFLVLQSKSLQQIFESKFFQHLGWLSYAIYISHLIVLFSLSAAVFLWVEPALGYLPSFLVAAVAGGVAVYLSSIVLTLYVDRPAVWLASYLSRRSVDLLSKLLMQVRARREFHKS